MTTHNELKTTIEKICHSGKGILAADESTATISKRFQAVGVNSDETSRRDYREMLLSTKGCNEFIAGVILFEETLSQKTSKDINFPEMLNTLNIVPGIKVDKGLKPIPFTKKEMVTQGLDELAERLNEYKIKGARFAKWRAVYNIGQDTPSPLAIDLNAHALARYAAICQAQGIVPIVEPEVLIDGDHTIEQCEIATEAVLQAVFAELNTQKVQLEYIILKPSMVINGKACAKKASVQQVAEATIRVLRRTVPAAVPTIDFLSGGQTSEQATAHLDAMNKMGNLPWNLSYSYARALQEYAMKIWAGSAKNVPHAQAAFYHRAKLNSLAAKGQYDESMENKGQVEEKAASNG